MTRTVFISSRMRGMEDLRTGARLAIEALGFRPIMAEDFRATASTPRGACLDGVRQADIVVLLVGPSYGEPQASGKSATEEEIDEARRLSKPVIILKTHETLEPAQEAFLRGLGGWIDGAVHREFGSRDELIKELGAALRQHEGAPDAVEVLRQVPFRLGVVVAGVRNQGIVAQDPRLSLAWVPVATRGFVDEDRFFTELPDRVADSLVSGTSSLSNVQPSVRAETDCLVVRTSDAHSGWMNLEVVVWIDGSMAVGTPIQLDTGRSVAHRLALPPSVVEATLGAELQLVGNVMHELDRNRVVIQGGVQVVLENLGPAHLRDQPPVTRTGGTPLRTIPRNQDMLRAPDDPALMARTDLRRDSPWVARLVRHLQRASQMGQMFGGE